MQVCTFSNLLPPTDLSNEIEAAGFRSSLVVDNAKALMVKQTEVNVRLDIGQSQPPNG